MYKKYKDRDAEVDLHIWKQAETKNLTALYTISIGKNAFCISMPLDRALEIIKEKLEEL